MSVRYVLRVSYVCFSHSYKLYCDFLYAHTEMAYLMKT